MRVSSRGGLAYGGASHRSNQKSQFTELTASIHVCAQSNPAPRACRFMGMSMSTVKLLQAAAEIVGGEDALAERLGITQARMAMLLADRVSLPDRLLLLAVDIILEDRQARGGVPPSNVHAQPRRV